jgi:hypothetical protein
MAYQSHHCSATMLYSTCICLFLHPFLMIYVLLPFMLYAPCPFYAPKSISIAAPMSSLFFVFILSVHFLRPPCIVPLHALQCAMVLFIGLFTTTPLFLCFARSSINTLSLLCMFSSCQVLFLIIMVIPQLF